MYEWEPCEPYYYSYGILADKAFGYHFHQVQVEQTIEGWHGILMNCMDTDAYGDDIEGGYMGMVDEAVFDAKYDAIAWCEYRDTKAYEREIGPEALLTEEEIWEAIINDEQGEEQ